MCSSHPETCGIPGILGRQHAILDQVPLVVCIGREFDFRTPCSDLIDVVFLQSDKKFQNLLNVTSK